jgi:hypothetical protein
MFAVVEIDSGELRERRQLRGRNPRKEATNPLWVRGLFKKIKV